MPFDGLAYIASYSDLIVALGADEAAGDWHYLHYGAAEGRARNIFDAEQYLVNYADLRAAFGWDPRAATVHWIQYGYFEGRTDARSAEPIEGTPGDFNGLAYIASYDDLIAAFGADEAAGERHFVLHGIAEGRVASFDTLQYIASYDDLIDAFEETPEAGSWHFIAYGCYGWAEGRSRAVRR